MIPDDCDLHLTQERVVKIKEPGPSAKSVHEHNSGYSFQQVVKMNADKYIKSDFCCHFDSDCLWTKPVTPDDLFVDGKPLWLMTPMVEVTAGDKNTHAHAIAMREFSGVDSEFEFMRRHSQCVPRWAYAAFRDYVQEKHGMSFEKWAMSRGFRGVTEFNFLGQLMYTEYRNFFHFHDTRFGVPEGFVRQFWSWNGITPEIKAETEMILA